MKRIWDIISDEERIALINYQWETHGTKLDVFIEQKQPVIYVPRLPDETEIARFMAEKPHHPAHIV